MRTFDHDSGYPKNPLLKPSLPSFNLLAINPGAIRACSRLLCLWKRETWVLGSWESSILERSTEYGYASWFRLLSCGTHAASMPLDTCL